MFGIAHLLWWGLLIVAIVLVARWLIGGTGLPGRSSEVRALAILKERYARGEINKAEFEARKRDIARDSAVRRQSPAGRNRQPNQARAAGASRP